MMSFCYQTNEQIIAELGARLKRARERQNVSLVDVAKKSSVPVELIEKLENGLDGTLKDFMAIVTALGLADSVEDILLPPQKPLSELGKQ